MDMASGGTSRGSATTSRSTNPLPSLFGEHGVNSVSNALATGKDLEGLMAMNDSALSQQIEFILQDAPMEQDDDECSAEDVVPASVCVNPPTRTLTSASDYNHVDESALITTSTHMRQDHLLNGRRIIIQPRETLAISHHHEMEEEDPELNDENLQDIEEEAQAAEAEEEPVTFNAQVKIEQPDMDDEIENENINYISANSITQHAIASQPPQQLMLPAGSIVSATSRGLTVPVSEALAQLQRRPVYISNAVGGMTGATFVRMPAVISRSPMTVLNVVQQNGARGGPTTQLILQAAPVQSSATPVVVSTNSSAAGTVAQTSGSAVDAKLTNQIASSNITSIALSSAAPSAPSTSKNVATVSAPTTATTSTSTPTTSSTTTTIYQCVDCVEKFESKELFDIHRSGHANNMKCAICNMVLKSLKNYEKHCLRCKPYECQICGRVVRFRPNFIKHMRVHTGQQSERHKYKCDVCHKEFMSFEYFKVHKKIHNDNVNLTCEICGKVFSALASLRGHSKLHSGVKLHKCDVCGKGFGQRYNLKIHARTHTGDFPYECKICKKKLHTQSSLQTHMQTHQRDQTSQVTTTIKYENSSVASNAAKAQSNTPSRATIIKLEPQCTIDEGPSTSGVQQQQQQQQPQQDRNLDEDADVTDGYQNAQIVTTTTTTGRNATTTTAEDSSNESSNASQQQQQQQHQQNHPLLITTPTRTIVIKNYMQNDHNVNVITHQPTQVIQDGAGPSNSALQQQLLRKTPIIHSIGGVNSLSSALASVAHQTGNSPSPSPSSSSTSCSSSVVVSKSGAPLSLASAAIGTSIIRSTRDHNMNSHSISSSHRALQRNNHRNHHRRRHASVMDDDDDDNDSTNLHNTNGRHFDDDDDDDKSSPSLATAAIKIEPNLYSSGSGDNSNDMLIKEEVMFEDSAAPHSPHSPPSSKYRMSHFDSDLVDHHVDLNHSLPPYGNLFEHHSIPDSIPTQLYPDDDDDFRLDHSSLGALHNTSSSTTDGDFIKKEWVYGAGSSYVINGKFEDENDALCDAANFIYN